jgi:hypothetical protein
MLNLTTKNIVAYYTVNINMPYNIPTMSTMSESVSIYQDWYRANGFGQEGPVLKAINVGWQHFNSATDPYTQNIHTRILAWVVAAFTRLNAMVER